MRGWILSVCGVAFLGVMVDIITPNGKTNTFVKSIFAILFLYVMANPILGAVSNLTSGNIAIESSNTYISVIKEQKINELQLRVAMELQANGYNNYNVEIRGDMVNNELKVKIVNIKCNADVLIDQGDIIQYRNNIADIVAKAIDVDKGVVVVE